MENKEKILESAQELKSGLNLLSRDRKVVMPHNKAFDHVDKLKLMVDEIINLDKQKDGIKGFFNLSNELKKRKFDQVFIFNSSLRYNLIAKCF